MNEESQPGSKQIEEDIEFTEPLCNSGTTESTVNAAMLSDKELDELLIRYVTDSIDDSRLHSRLEMLMKPVMHWSVMIGFQTHL